MRSRQITISIPCLPKCIRKMIILLVSVFELVLRRFDKSVAISNGQFLKDWTSIHNFTNHRLSAYVKSNRKFGITNKPRSKFSESSRWPWCLIRGHDKAWKPKFWPVSPRQNYWESKTNHCTYFSSQTQYIISEWSTRSAKSTVLPPIQFDFNLRAVGLKRKQASGGS